MRDVTEQLLTTFRTSTAWQRDCVPDKVRDPDVTAWVTTLEQLLHALELGEAKVALGPNQTVINIRHSGRRHAKIVLAKASWLAPDTRAALTGFLERTPEYVRHLRYRFSTDWLSPYEARWREVLAPYRDTPARFLEIGSFEGRSAVWLFDNILTHPESTLTCIDLFTDAAAEQVFDENVAAAGATSRAIKLRGPSHASLRRLGEEGEERFDFIYVDGSHEQEDVLEDAVLAWRLLKPGGILTFDDYEMARYAIIGWHPEIGIDAFLNVFQRRYTLLSRGFQLTIQKLAAPAV